MITIKLNKIKDSTNPLMVKNMSYPGHSSVHQCISLLVWRSTMSHYHISSLLEKMKSSDKDFRFMATNDLMSELQRDGIKLDDESERQVVQMLLKLLDDKNGEVQNLAVKCLGPLITKVKDAQVEVIADSLCQNMVTGKEQLRDISSIGLKTVIGGLPASSASSLAANICRRVTGKLTSTVTKTDVVSVQLDALEILGDLLTKYGGLLQSFHSSIQSALFPQLTSSRMAVRKRTIIALSSLVHSSSSPLFVELIDHLLSELTQDKMRSTTRTYIQCAAAISRAAGHRMGEYLGRVFPHVVKFCQVEDDDELREYCIQAFEAFVSRCPKEVTPHVPQIIDICLKLITYDPNYNYDSDDEQQTMEIEDNQEEEESDDDYSDDDDMSWKVRRAAAKCLGAVLGSRPELLSELYKTVSPKLISRFKEREENVKADIFAAYIVLLQQTKLLTSRAMEEDLSQSEGPIVYLQSQTAQIVQSIHKQMMEKSIKTRQGCFSLLTQLVNVLPGVLGDHLGAIVPGIQFSLSDRSSTSNMKIDTLTFLHVLLTNLPSAVFHPHVVDLVPVVVTAVGDSFYKITSEALLVTQQLVRVIRPLESSNSFDFNPFVNSLYESTLARLKAADIDQEVKERAIACMGQILTNLGDVLSAKLLTCLPIFVDRLRNEITRLAAVKAVSMIASSPLKLNLKEIVSTAIPLLASFLRKNNRALRLATLELLRILISNYGSLMSSNDFDSVMKELPPLISESDLHVSQLTLNLLTTLGTANKASLYKTPDGVLPAILNLLKSPLLQGGALSALLSFLHQLVLAGLPGLQFNDILKLLTETVYNPIPMSPTGTSFIVHKQAFHSIAKCSAVLCVARPEQGIAVVTQLMAEIKNKETPDSVRLYALLSLGEIGKDFDLSSQPELLTVIEDSFLHPSEEVKSAASHALGNVSSGNLSKFLPFILQEIEAQPKRQYLLLHSLKEVITRQSSSSASIEAFTPHVNSIWTLLFKHCESNEEGTRNVVAECLGKLTLINPSELLPLLQSTLTSASSYARSTVVTAVKFTISDQPQKIDTMLKSCIGHFLETLQDPDLNVRRVALVTFNSAAHNKPILVRDLLHKVLPQLYGETVVRKELIREVEMGPFKHTVDDGLDIRKAAYECMYTLLDSCLERLDIYEFLSHVENALKDHYDIKMLAYLMLARLSTLAPHAVLQRLDSLIAPLSTTVHMKVKPSAVKQEFEKQDELKRSALRAVAALITIPDSDKSPALTDFIGNMKANGDLSAMFDAIQRDVASSSMETMDTS
ncbi:cullin-associated NEDD8-dissociated protein 1-like isoform X2 [Corticium candelabrum]|uniref:cullin-associated NEDD8-dissociated protein 1-like isoform X2 n=1 Tax=Corticium candelabrum TaxID=121492 RepID=UPI002E258D7E|nr:cullin-associated NEDD8-dissociated protein 1-like isoform X2 [Corticium candelabrum]